MTSRKEKFPLPARGGKNFFSRELLLELVQVHKKYLQLTSSQALLPQKGNLLRSFWMGTWND